MFKMNNENELFIHEKSMPEDVEVALDYLDLEDNNISGRIAHLRDTFLAAEREYVMELLNDNEIREKIIKYNMLRGDQLCLVAQDLVDRVENNLIPYEEMEKTEKILTILLSAIHDKVLRKQLIRLPMDDISRGRSR